ncbi:MAG: acyl-ACP--UDP-N-acetylglucosamine O-acyltransferase [Hyphomicrobiales bacterium]|nr:MAG: acyl-ACP--UDP-N-acetylglucosamine O-acyltransferase [Hyphomicrobiales bacterium]
MIHPTAIIESGASIAADVEIGPFCTVGAGVSIGSGTRLVSHVVICGTTTIGSGNTIYPFASLGLPSPDLKYKGEPATLEVGDNNVIRESVTMHIGTGAGGGKTVVGNGNLLMPGTHVAHDCIVGNNTIIANYVQLAGHVHIADNVTIGGLSGIHQYVRVGTHAIIGGHTAVDHDVPPYANVSGRRAALKGLNLVGLRRRGFEKTLIKELDVAYDTLFDETVDDLPLMERAKNLKRDSKSPEVTALADFVLNTQRGVTGYDDE